MVCANGCRLRDGRVVILRDAGPQDVPAIMALYAGLSGESAGLRFNGACGPATLARLARIDSAAGTACVIAAREDDPGAVVAEARYVPSGPGVAELALTVADDWQGTGLGRLLLAAIVQRAGAAGLTRLQAVVNLANAPMLHLLKPYGWVLAEPTELALASLEIPASGDGLAWPQDAPGRRVLVERRGWFDGGQVTALRAAGDVVRVCLGPQRQAGRPCPLLVAGRCELAAGADLIVPALPADDEDCAAVLGAHRRLWPGKLAPAGPGSP